MTTEAIHSKPRTLVRQIPLLLVMLPMLISGGAVAKEPGARAGNEVSGNVRGRLANPGFVNQRIKTTLFFAGQALDGIDEPDDGCALPTSNNTWAYTLHPADGAHLRWSDAAANRLIALDAMVGAGINVINMSSWGEDFLGCASWMINTAPMQTSPQAHNELFDAAATRSLLIVPYLESRGGVYPWSFRSEFPTDEDGQVAPGTVSQIKNLIARYLKDPAPAARKDRWARVYDRNGQERYAVAIIHAASDRLSASDHAAFATGFDAIAEQVYQETNVLVGFFIDVLPPGTNAVAAFLASPESTGPLLADINSVLGIQCFIPEIWPREPQDTASRYAWKQDFTRRWFLTGIPFIVDVCPGYDNSGFPNGKWLYGYSTDWINNLTQLITDYGQAGVIFNSWNGYTEGMVAVPVSEPQYGRRFYDWFRWLPDVYAQKPDAPPPRNGTLASPFTLSEAIQLVPDRGVIGLLPTTTASFDPPLPLTITKPCRITAVGGSATISQ